MWNLCACVDDDILGLSIKSNFTKKVNHEKHPSIIQCVNISQKKKDYFYILNKYYFVKIKKKNKTFKGIGIHRMYRKKINNIQISFVFSAYLKNKMYIEQNLIYKVCRFMFYMKFFINK